MLFACPHCHQQISLPSEDFGRQCKCPHCEGVFQVAPSKDAAPPAATDHTKTILPSVDLPNNPANPPNQLHQGDTLWAAPVGQPDAATPTPDTSQSTWSNVTSEKPPLLPGYEILTELGRGGMGVVYQAKHIELNRIVALKMILAGGHAGDDDVRRFLSEAEAVAALAHPNIVQVFDFGRLESRPYMALEFVPGGSLAGVLKNGPLPVQEAARLVEQLAQGMNVAHQAGIVHRDLKPDNILLTQEGTPKVTDFGLAKRIEGGGHLTQTGVIMGTPAYMAPEQATGQGKRVGPAADVYALGAILYACLTGRPPFQGDDVMNTIVQVTTQDPIPPRQHNKHIPRDLETICLKCLEKDPHKRYASANDLAEDLHCWQTGEPITARRVGQGERTLKWIRRRPAIAGLLALVAFLLVAGTGVSSFLALQANWRAYEAEAANQRANANAEKARRAMHDAVVSAKAAKRQKTLAEKQAARADQEKKRAEKNAVEAEKQRQRAIENAKQIQREKRQADKLLYMANIRLAARNWEDANLRATENLLNSIRPDRTGDVDLRGFEWHYLWHCCHPPVASLSGYRAAFDPSGKRLVTTSGSSIRLYDRTNRTRPKQWSHPDWVNAIAFHPHGTLFASAGRDSNVRLWDVDSGKVLRHLPDTGKVTSLAFDPSGKRIATSGHDRMIRLWHTDTGKLLQTLKDGNRAVHAIQFDRNGERIASICAGPGGRTVKVWDVKTGQVTHTFTGRGDVTFTQDGKRLVFADENDLIKVIDLDTKKVVHTLHGHQQQISQLCVHPAGTWLASGSADRTIKIWNLATGRLVRTLKGHSAPITSLSFSPQGGRLLSASTKQSVKVWDLSMEEFPYSSKSHSTLIRSIAFHPTGDFFASASAGTVILWNGTTGRIHRVLRGHQSDVWEITFSPDGKWLASAGTDRTVRLWKVPTGELLHTLPHGTGVHALTFSPDSKQLVTAPSNGKLHFWETATGKKTHSLSFPARVQSLTYIADGTQLLMAHSEAPVAVRDPQTGKTLRTYASQSRHLVVSPDAKYMACTERDVVKLWDLQSGDLVKTFPTPGATIYTLTFSPDGQRLLSGGTDELIRIWDVATGQPLSTLKGHKEVVGGLAFRPDGHWLVSGGEAGVVKIWKAIPRSTVAWHRERAAHLEQQGRYAAAVSHLLHLTKHSPTDPMLCFRYGRALVYRGRADEAKRQFAKALAQKQTLPPFYKGDALAELGDWHKAQITFQKATAEKNASSSVWSRFVLVSLRSEGQQAYRKACTNMVTRFRNIAERNSQTANRIAYHCILAPNNEMDWALLEKWMTRKVKKYPTRWQYAGTLGLVLYRAGKTDAAIRVLNDAIARHGNGGSIDMHLGLAMAYHRRKDVTQAERWFRKAKDRLATKAQANTAGDRWFFRVAIHQLAREAEMLLSQKD